MLCFKVVSITDTIGQNNTWAESNLFYVLVKAKQREPILDFKDI